MKTLILASSSPYRRELLQTLKIEFSQKSPNLDETPLKAESPRALSKRLAIAKAEHIAAQHPAWVLGSDQVAEVDGLAVGKPGDFENAFAQLQRASGKTCVFYTTVALAHPQHRSKAIVDEVRVQFRDLSDEEISRYLLAEMPYDTAGSFKSEGLGVSLFSSIHSSQPGSLIGLPMIATCSLLREAGFLLP